MVPYGVVADVVVADVVVPDGVVPVSVVHGSRWCGPCPWSIAQCAGAGQLQAAHHEQPLPRGCWRIRQSSGEESWTQQSRQNGFLELLS